MIRPSMSTLPTVFNRRPNRSSGQPCLVRGMLLAVTSIILSATAAYGQADRFQVEAQATSVNVNTPVIVVVTALDDTDTPIANYDPTSNITIDTTGAGGAISYATFSPNFTSVSQPGDGRAIINASIPGETFDANGQLRFRIVSSVVQEVSVIVTEGTASGNTSDTDTDIKWTGTTPTQLQISAIPSPAEPFISADVLFDVTVTAVDAVGTELSVTDDTNVEIILKEGAGFVGGNMTGTISAGSKSTTISVFYSQKDQDVVLTAITKGENSLNPGNSNPFDVYEDCNYNDVPDAQEIADNDCNNNNRLDECDLVDKVAFRPPTNYEIVRGDKIEAIDVDVDGAMDLAVIYSYYDPDTDSNNMRMWAALNNGEGQFNLRTLSPTTLFDSELTDLAAGDMNHDGATDLVILTKGTPDLAQDNLNYKPGQLHVRINNGPGNVSFTDTSISIPTNASALDLADFNGDGFLDISIGHGEQIDPSSPASLGIRLNDGSGDAGAFLAASSTVRLGEKRRPLAIAAVDLNGDNKPDVATVCAQTTGYDSDAGDSDGDGVNDGDDNCLYLPNNDQANADSDEFGDVCDDDIDGDTIPNEDDNCPLTSNELQEDLDGDKIGAACDEDDTPIIGSDVGTPEELPTADADAGEPTPATTKFTYEKGELFVYFTDGQGHMTTRPAPVTVGNQPVDITALDIDGDGDLDLAVANQGGPAPDEEDPTAPTAGSVSIIRNNG